MGVNKVNYGNDNLIDLTNDTVTESTLLRGTTAHNRAGEGITGTLDVETDGITWDEAQDYVGYNLCPFDPYIGTNNGITSTIVDGHKIKINGTSTTTFGLGISEPISSYQTIGTHLLRAGSYKLLVESSAALSSSCFVSVYSNNDELACVNSGTSGSDTFTLEEDTTLMVAIGFASSTIVSNLIIQAMIVKDTIDSDVPYQDYLPRNDELDTKKVDGSIIAIVENGPTSSKIYTIGEHFMYNGHLCTATSYIAVNTEFVLNNNYEITDVASCLKNVSIIEIETSENVNKSGGSWQDVIQIQVPPGIYLIMATVVFADGSGLGEKWVRIPTNKGDPYFRSGANSELTSMTNNYLNLSYDLVNNRTIKLITYCSNNYIIGTKTSLKAIRLDK